MAQNAAPLPAIGLVLPPVDAALHGLFFVYGGDPADDRGVFTYLRVGRKLVAEYGEFTLSGQDATLDKVSPSAHQAAPLPALGLLDLFVSTDRVMPCSFGSFTISGSADMHRGVALAAEVGTFTVAGAPAARDMELDAEPGVFAVQSAFVGLTSTRTLSCDYGSFSLYGVDAGLVYEQPGAKRLIADAGLFEVFGGDPGDDRGVFTTFGRTALLVCDYGTFTVTGCTLRSGHIWQQVIDNDSTWTERTPTDSSWSQV